MSYLFLLTAVFLVYLWINNPTASLYTLQLIGLFVLFYFLNKKRKTPNNFIASLIFTIVVLLLISTTGGLGSPLFFLIYLLLFGVSLMLTPIIAFVLTLSLIAFFAFLSPLGNVNNLITLASLLFISPLALFFGKQYLKVLSDQKKIKILQKTKKKLNQAIKNEETDSLIWLSLELKNGIQRIIEKTKEALNKTEEKEELEEILANAERLERTGEKLKKEIDQETD